MQLRILGKHHCQVFFIFKDYFIERLVSNYDGPIFNKRTKKGLCDWGKRFVRIAKVYLSG